MTDLKPEETIDSARVQDNGDGTWSCFVTDGNGDEFEYPFEDDRGYHPEVDDGRLSAERWARHAYNSFIAKRTAQRDAVARENVPF